MRAYEIINEGDVIDTKFTQKLSSKKGMYHNPDIEIPISKKTGEPYQRFETKKVGKTASSIIGINVDGDSEIISTTTHKVASALASAYNAGGYTDKEIKKYH